MIFLANMHMKLLPKEVGIYPQDNIFFDVLKTGPYSAIVMNQ